MDAKTNASETERYAFIEGTLRLNEPVSTVRAARMIQRLPIGSDIRPKIEWATA
jgi:hypothetical protein